jgi:hypothetical protein
LVSEEKTPFFEPTFNRSVKLRARDQRLSSDGCVLLLREADERLGLVESLASQLYDPRRQELIRYHVDELLRERIFPQALGYSVQDEVDLLAHDPALRIAIWNRPGEQVLDERGASQPTQSRLTDLLSNHKQNLEAMRSALPDWVGRHLRASGKDRAVVRGTLDIDSFPIEVFGSQEGAAYNGYYRKKMYHPIVASFAPGGDYDSNRLGDGFVHAVLRAGNVHTASGAVRFIREAVKRSSTLARSIDVRLDAGYTAGSILDPLTDDGIRFIGRLKTNEILQKKAQPYLNRPVGRPPTQGYEKIIELGEHRAESRRHAQRLILVVVDKPDPKTGQLEFFPRYFFLVTSWKPAERTAAELLAHYRRRGTFEDRLGELSQAISPHMSSPRFVENEINLLLSLLSHNLLSILRGELEDESGNGWDVARLQRTVLKTAVRVTKASRRLIVDVALSAVGLWNSLLERMKRWRLPTRWRQPKSQRKRRWIPPPRHAFLEAVLRE